MEATLLTAGVLCLISAVVGGGVKAFGAEFPALASVRRQALLAILGLVLLFTALAIRFLPDLRTERSDTISTSSESANTGRSDSASLPELSRDAGTSRTPANGVAETTERAPAQRREHIAEAQLLLEQLGYRVGPADGMDGATTRKAIQQFQAANGIPSDGVAGPRTLEKLRQAVEERSR